MILLIVSFLGYLFRAPILRNAARILVSDDGSPECTRIAIKSGDRRYDRAASMIAEGKANGVLQVQLQANRLEQLGLVPMSEVIDRRELNRRGVTDDRIELTPGSARTTWDWGRQIGIWLEQNPDATVLVLSDRFSSRHDRLVLRQVLTKDQRTRVRVAGLLHREHDETNWWNDKDGVLDFAHRLLGLTHVWLVGEPDPGPEAATVEELEGRGK